ncbi:hypothetical protein KVP10_15475 [Candidimonas humi]|uniref:Uncharacterized protein n=1 Tax=Candidimonas humi TaxID=683355 RepID=A0ABV8P0E7_9BURK|nr:hypothetical protein [Candidimonas humi]MBV6306291.1 hypothetical protein [Candidimonas humi]
MNDRSYTEAEIQDLTDRVFLLKERLEAGKIHFAPHLIEDFRRSFEAIRLRPDGKVDPRTVDGRIRASTLAIVAMNQREEMKNSATLQDLQEKYFEFLFEQFGWLYDQMVQHKVPSYVIAEHFAKEAEFVDKLFSVIPDCEKAVKDFWEVAGEISEYHLQDGHQLKSVFSGDLCPSYDENVVSTAGLYVDTIILPCPVLRVAPLGNFLPKSEVVKLFVKHVLTVMTYRNLATADVSPPIVLIVPSRDDIQGRGSEHSVTARAAPLMVQHGNRLFGRSFQELDELTEFCSGLVGVEDVVSQLKCPERLLFDTEWGGDATHQLRTAMTENPVLPGMDQDVAGHQVITAALGRMPQAMAAEEAAFQFGGSPLISAPTSWSYYTWLLEYQGARARNRAGNIEACHVAHALTTEAGTSLQWLGNVPPESVLEIRRNGLAEELRGVLSSGLSDLLKVNPENYFRTADQVVENLDLAFRKHQQDLLEAKRRKLKLYGIDVPTCLAVGAIGVAGAMTGSIPLQGISAALSVVGLATLKDIKTKYVEIAEADKVRRTSPTGILFRHLAN